MSSHHDHDNHSTEAKPVSFRTPLIMGLVTIFLILVAVSTCDGGKHHDEAGHQSGHEAAAVEHGTNHTAKEETHAASTEEHTVVADTLAKVDTSAVKEVKAEEHAPAHH